MKEGEDELHPKVALGDWGTAVPWLLNRRMTRLIGTGEDVVGPPISRTDWQEEC